MASFENKFDSSRQDWTTPQWLFDHLDFLYQYEFDLAADSENAKCKRFFSEQEDALSQDWTYLGRCWLNPPYGGNGKNSLKRWVQKAYESAKWPTCHISMLMPARTNTVWWHDYCMKARMIWLIKGRPKFGDAKYGLPQPLAVVMFSGLTYSYPMVRSLYRGGFNNA